MRRATPRQPDMTHRLVCEARDHFGAVIFEGATLEEAQAKVREANRLREAQGKQPFVVVPYAVIAL